MEPWRFQRGELGWMEHFNQSGFAVVEGILTTAEVETLKEALAKAVGSTGYAKRNLLQTIVEVAALANSRAIKDLVTPVLGTDAFPVKGILFDKTPDANWKVAWHQDTMICVRERIDTPGYGPWSVKDGVTNVMPTADVLAGVVTVRMHLDGCGVDNGPLRVIPGSHQAGLLSGEAIDQWRETGELITCSVCSGGVLLMRPLTLHASSSATSPRHRRVIHLEYSASALPNGLHWANY